MNKKSLAIKLSKLKSFDNPSLKLEQYTTDSEVAAEILWHAYLNNNIENKKIADFGCGSGIFGIGALLLEAKHVDFYDIDKNVLKIAKNNLQNNYSGKNFTFSNKDINNVIKKVDVIFQNPPFGVQKKHADKVFLEKAMEISPVIYSVHKIESKKFIRGLVKKYNFEIKDVLKFKLPLKKTQKFHKKRMYYVNVGCFVLYRNI